MTFFKVDYSKLDNKDYSAVDKGEYEVIIQKVQRKVTKNGKEAVTFWLLVRNDLVKVPILQATNGKFPNRYVFDDHWKRDIDGQYVHDLQNLMYVLQAAGVPEGTAFNSFEDFEEALVGKPVRVYIDKEWSDYNQAEENTVAPWNYKPTEFPQVNHVPKDDQAPNPAQPKPEAPVISDNELPF